VFPGLRQCFGPAGQRDVQPHRYDMGDQELGPGHGDYRPDVLARVGEFGTDLC
jgi:hypothetical protein